jgi:hypothetical protein
MQRRGEIVGWSTGALGFAALALSNSLAFAAPLQARQNLALQQRVDLELVHLGLNPKGKPGLWLVQKTH